jgi:hypothetical protein
MEGMSLGGELVLVSACLTVTPPITGGQEHTHTCSLDSACSLNLACLLEVGQEV